MEPATAALATYYFDDLALWRRRIRGGRNQVSPHLFGENPVVVGDIVALTLRGAHALMAFDRASGKVRWRRPVESLPHGGIVVVDGVLFAATTQMLYAVLLDSGRLLWRRPLGPELSSSDSAIVVDQGRFFFADRAGLFWCLDSATGKTLWSRMPPFRTERVPVNGVPAVVADLVILPTLPGFVVAYAAGTGEEVWRRDLEAGSADQVQVLGGDVVVRGGNRIYRLDSRSGEIQQRWQLGNQRLRSCTVGGDRLLIVSIGPEDPSAGANNVLTAIRDADTLFTTPIQNRWGQVRWDAMRNTVSIAGWEGLRFLDGDTGEHLVHVTSPQDWRASNCNPPTLMDDELFVLTNASHLYRMRHPIAVRQRADSTVLLDADRYVSRLADGLRVSRSPVAPLAMPDPAVAEERAAPAIERWIARFPVAMAERVRGFIAGRWGLHAVLQHVEDEARALGHTWIGTEHLMLGVLRFGYRPALVPHSMGLELEAFRTAVVGIQGRGTNTEAEMLPLAPDALLAFTTAMEISTLLDQPLDPDLLLVGIVDQPICAAVQALEQLGVSPTVMRVQLDLQMLPAWFDARKSASEISLPAFASFVLPVRQICVHARAVALRESPHVLDLALLLQSCLHVYPRTADILQDVGISAQGAEQELLLLRRAAEADRRAERQDDGKVNLTGQVRTALQYVARHARGAGYPSVRVEQLLLGMVAVQEGDARVGARASIPPSPLPATNVLQHLGVNAGAFRAELERRLQQSP